MIIQASPMLACDGYRRHVASQRAYRILGWRNQPEEIAAAVRRSVEDTASDGSNNDYGT
jgi:hypothetical protein